MRSFTPLVLLLAACSPRPAGPAPPPGVGPHPGGHGEVHVAGEEHGYLEPCGCTRPQLGGLARKATALDGAPLLENGDLVDRPGRLSELKFETFLLALSEIGCRALNIGEKDLALGIDYLRSTAGLARFPLISANIPDASGKPAFPAAAGFEHGGKKYVAIGVLDPSLAPGGRLLDPAESLAAPLAETPAAGVTVILLFHGPASGARRLLDRYPRIDVAVCAHGNGEPSVLSPKLVNPGDRSRWMIRLGEQPAVVELAENFANDPRMERSLRTYVRRLREEDLLHRLNPQAPPRDGGYVGSRACAKCHPGVSRTHEASRHALAIEVLARTGREIDPDCVKCHVIGYGEKTGFTSVTETPDLARVGCENCHGPAKNHIEDPGANRPAADPRRACVSCHNEDADPHFDFAKKWSVIRH